MNRAGYCFTLNNPEYSLDTLFGEHTFILYGIWQGELGENGTYHYQGYVECRKGTNEMDVLNMMPEAHFERRRGTREEARAYAMKEDTRVDGPYEYGRFVDSKSKIDWDGLKKFILEGRSDLDIFNVFPQLFIKHPSGISKAQKLITQCARDIPEVTFLFGTPGTGKSTWVLEASPTAYWKQPDTVWWDGYDGRSDIVLDDFYGWLPYSTLLRLLDRFPMMVQTKGGNQAAAPKRVYITSNKKPEDWYRNLYAQHAIDIEALYRRVSRILVFSALGEHSEVSSSDFRINTY